MFGLCLVRRIGFVGCVLALLVAFPVAALAQIGEPEADSGGEEYSVSIPLPDRLCQGVHATGQLVSIAPGDDGDYEAGFTTGAFSSFTDNGDGTVKDNLTGLIWLQWANCFGLRNWSTAVSDANTLADGTCGLMDGSMASDWRLPNVRELQSLIDYSQSFAALPVGHPFSEVQEASYY